MCKYRQNTSKQPLQCGLLQALPELSPHPPHTRGTFHRRPEPLYTEKRKVSCPGFLPKQSPCNIHAARCNTFCKQRFQNSRQLQCARKGKTHRSSHYSADYSKPWPNPARNCRTHEVPWIAGRSHFTRKNARFPAPAFSQNEAHATSMQPVAIRFATSGSKPASLDAHGNTQRQQSCTHYTAICNQSVKKRIVM